MHGEADRLADRIGPGVRPAPGMARLLRMWSRSLIAGEAVLDTLALGRPYTLIVRDGSGTAYVLEARRAILPFVPDPMGEKTRNKEEELRAQQV
ncbi:hypothetical protein [Streptomyces pini]|uniref:Uncharacterized protein n=1 Tax=Streptomyces pini TaxID=1520580 RepID=A0A1I4KW10_9ACTN|nr:hypothetical protein [Streptomyces pini]SFL82803.1 hypothetical protein SAMN05192584_12850 [Streptomyces pini]